MIDLTAALRLVTRARDSLHMRYMVVGCTTAAAWGVVRATRDVDLVMAVESSSGADLLDQVRSGRRPSDGGGSHPDR